LSGRRTQKKLAYYSPKRRAVYATGDDIDHLILFELHGWMCWVCKHIISPHLRMPNNMAATVEHIIPLCKGGTHTWDNVAPAHAVCNFSKADSLPSDFNGTMTV
jgi:5-methylcytosine-specific restriction endonuclease McrA